MTAFKPRQRIVLALLGLGAFSQIAQALLVRESLVAFYGNEVSLGAFFASWLWWIACGSLIAIHAWRRGWAQRPRRVVSALLLALPPLLVLQILLARSARLFLDVAASEFIPLGELFLTVALVSLPTGLVIGFLFPWACKALVAAAPAGEGDRPGRAVSDVSRLYIVEALGALLGGVLFTFVMIEGIGVWRSLGYVALTLVLISALLSGKGRRLRTLQFLLAIAATAVAVTPIAGWLQGQMEGMRFRVMQPALELLGSVETRYGHVAVARHGEQTSIIVDGRILESYPALDAVRQRAAYLYAQAAGSQRVLLFGGYAGGLAEALLEFPVAELDVVEQDRRAYEMLYPWLMASTRRALEDPRLSLRFVDGRRFANQQEVGAGYDLVLVLTDDPASADSNRFFTQEFYRSISRAMAPDGVLCTAVSSASNYLGREVASYSGSVYRTLSSVFPQIAVMPGDEHIYCASRIEGRVTEDASVLEARYLEVPLHERHRVEAQTFQSLLPAERVAFVREQLQVQHGALNSDVWPITYYLNMVLWGKFSASEIVTWLEALRGMGYWPYLVPLMVFVCLWLLRSALEATARPRLQRQAATLALVLLGMVAMAVQLIILLGYQSHVGIVFSRIALLNGLFMTGLALGAGGVGQWLVRRRQPGLSLAVVLGLVAAGLALLPVVFGALSGWDSRWQEGAYLALSVAAGLLTGTGFPLGVHQAQVDTREVLRTGAIAEAADDLGGAAGGLLTGALLVPLLGVTTSSYLLALLALVAVIPLLYARFASKSLPPLRARGHRSFPWAGLSWSLAFMVITLGVLSHLARQTAPAPLAQFNHALLSQVSASSRFEFRDAPVPHYIGRGAATAQGPEEPETVSLASITVAEEVRGYAGPINLLVSVDAEGVLRGVHYIDSNETPAYIAGIDGWLAGLAGRDVSQTALTLKGYDALTGATVSSRAALQAVNRTLQAGGQIAFGQAFGGQTPPAAPAPWRDPGFLLTAVLLLAFFPVYFSGRDGLRLGYQFAVLMVLGVHLNTLFTETDLINLSLGQVSSWSGNPQRWLLLGFILVSALLFGQVWCGYLCPFGALQELLSRLGRRLYLRSYVEQELERRVRYLKYLLLSALLVTVWFTADATWAAFDPMQYLFGGRFGGWVAAVIVVSLIGALVYVRFWCRYFCPVGAFLSLFNKLALLDRFGPRRRFEHCDLGVRHDFDVDCIRCHRCLSGRDCGLRHRPRGDKGRRHSAAKKH